MGYNYGFLAILAIAVARIVFEVLLGSALDPLFKRITGHHDQKKIK